jgi:serine/threonine-protein kinase
METNDPPTRREVTPARSRAAESRDASARHDGERYELLGELAAGGMATVYLGRMRRPMGFARLVAIKCMHPQYAKDPAFASMFLDEARLTARLRHPNIVPTLDIVADGKHLLIVMEYVAGESLAALLGLVRAANERVPVPVACAIIHDVLLGLHEAHEARDDEGAPLAIVHRDVSPQNVILGLDGLARVLDFGVAKARSRVHHSNEGEIKGKLPYMPPEQLFGEGLDRRVDVYAAGVLLWEALVGARLFEGASEEVLVRRIDAGTVEAPSRRAADIPPALDALVLRALAKAPDGRFPTALAMAEALSAIAPLPPRTAISAWMRRYSTARALPTTAGGTALALSDLSEGVSEGVRAEALVAALERATEASRPSLAPISTTARTPTPPTPRFAVVAGIAIFAVAGVLFGRTMRAETARAATTTATDRAAAAERTAAEPLAAAAAAATAAAATTAAASTTAAAATTAAASRAEDLTVARAPAAPSKGSQVARAVRGLAPTTAASGAASPTSRAAMTPAPSDIDASAASAAPPSTPSSCRLPYTVDGEGHRHYKVECL